MPNMNTINFGPGQSNVDLQAQQIQLQRQQQIADMLRQQALTPTETQVVSGRAVKNSPWLGVTQMAKALLANRMQDKSDAKQLELGNTAAQRSAAALRALAPPGMFDSSPGAAQAGPLPDQPLSGTPMASTPGQQPAAAAPQGAQVSPEMKQAWARALTLYQTNPELGGKLIQNLTELTGNQKDWAAQGVDPRALGAAMLNKEKAGGLVNVAPNNTVLDAGTGKPVFAAPDFANGRNNTFGQNGAPQIAPMQGAEAIPQQAGAVEGAKAGAQAGFDMVTVNTPNGPVMMTRAQAAQMAGGGAPQAQGAPIKFTASNGVSLNFANQTPQQLFQAAKASGDPQLMQAFNEWAQSGTAKPAGIPLQSEAQKKEQVGKVELGLEVERDRIKNAQSPEQIQKLADAQGVVGLTQMARGLLEEGSATGSLGGSLRDKVAGAVGVSTDASKAAAQLAAIGGALVSKQPKMTGPQSDKDVLLYKEMAGRVGDASVPIGDRLAALSVVESISNKYIDQNTGAVAGVTQKANQTNAPVRRYNPATGRIE